MSYNPTPITLNQGDAGTQAWKVDASATAQLDHLTLIASSIQRNNLLTQQQLTLAASNVNGAGFVPLETPTIGA